MQDSQRHPIVGLVHPAGPETGRFRGGRGSSNRRFTFLLGRTNPRGTSWRYRNMRNTGRCPGRLLLGAARHGPEPGGVLRPTAGMLGARWPPFRGRGSVLVSRGAVCWRGSGLPPSAPCPLGRPRKADPCWDRVAPPLAPAPGRELDRSLRSPIRGAFAVSAPDRRPARAARTARTAGSPPPGPPRGQGTFDRFAHLSRGQLGGVGCGLRLRRVPSRPRDGPAPGLRQGTLVPRCREQRPQCDVSGLPKSGRGSPAGPCPFVCTRRSAGGFRQTAFSPRSRQLAPVFLVPLGDLVSWWFCLKRQEFSDDSSLGSAIRFTTSPPRGPVREPWFRIPLQSSRLCAFAVSSQERLRRARVAARVRLFSPLRHPTRDAVPNPPPCAGRRWTGGRRGA